MERQENSTQKKADQTKQDNVKMPKWFPEFCAEWEKMQKTMRKIQWIARDGNCT